MKSLTLTGKTSAAGDLTYYLLKSTKSLLLTSDARALDQLLRAAAHAPRANKQHCLLGLYTADIGTLFLE